MVAFCSFRERQDNCQHTRDQKGWTHFSNKGIFGYFDALASRFFKSRPQMKGCSGGSVGETKNSHRRPVKNNSK